jgi:hypothetical protein
VKRGNVLMRLRMLAPSMARDSLEASERVTPTCDSPCQCLKARIVGKIVVLQADDE